MAYPTKLVSVTKAGVAGNEQSGINGSISGSGSVSQTEDMAAISQSSDGRFVVFASAATNFYANDTNVRRDIFLKDMVTGTLTPVATSTSSEASFPEVSDDGRYVAFQHGADIWLRDMTTSGLELVSKNVAGTQIAANAPEMSNDGRYIVFNSTSGDVSGHQQVYLRDMQTGTTRLISVDSDGTTMGNGDSFNACVSEDGKYVVFQSKSSNYAAGNANAYDEVFLKNVETGALTRISEKADHTGGATGASINATFSGNGRYVVFESAANDLDNITNGAGNSTVVSVIYRKDLVTGNVDLVSEGKPGTAAAYCSDPSISADGRFVLFKTHMGGVGDPALNYNAIQSPAKVASPYSPDYYSYYYIKDMATGEVYNIDLPRGSLTIKISVLGHTVTSPTSYAGLFPYEGHNATISADGKHITLSSTQPLDTGKITKYVDLNGVLTPDDDLKGNTDGQFDVFSIDVSKLTGKSVPGKPQLGGAGADILIGGLGPDKLMGLGGDDLYKVELFASGTGAKLKAQLKHLVMEASGQGNDTMQVFGAISGLLKAIALTLPGNVENLDFSATGSALINFKGNAENNQITGNSAANLIDGQAGNDTLIGGLGNDTLIGGLGVDSLSGGAGDDTYLVALQLDAGKTAVVIEDTLENDADGMDTLAFTGNVAPAGAITLDVADFAGFEGIDISATGSSKNLNLAGTDDANLLVGNKAVNNLTGGAGNDTLNGGGGSDSLDGGTGNDVYVVDNNGDVITETGEDTGDTVQSLLKTYTLGDTLENLVIGGKSSGSGAGNASPNQMTGNDGRNELDGKDGNDTLNGGLGNDKLTGGNGNDVFVFDTALKGNIDTITDFTSGSDQIHLDPAIFTALGSGFGAANLVNGKTAADGNDFILYDIATGTLSYDADGNGAGAAVKFAILGNKVAIGVDDFSLV